MSVLRVDNLRVTFGSQVILNNLSFEVNQGEVLAVLGPNGAGKTVLFRALLGLVTREGVVEWPKNIKIGYVPQKLAVARDLPLSVLDFLKLKESSEAEIYEALRSVGFLKSNGDEHHERHHLLNARVGELSGGQFQRVMIAYALINHPDVLLFDEPTTGIDLGGEETIYALLEKLHKNHKLTIILITHDLNVVYRYASKALCLNREKVHFGAPKEVLNPQVLEDLYGAKVGLYTHDHQH
ncbi:MAG: zinc transport system ATP-binding protein [Parcubacteria group bacterium Gr01-1014_19]|nr:MAG: zinc transport system ATP-binding protein [Parcubacteria group bacterium Gr01-1014_19]